MTGFTTKKLSKGKIRSLSSILKSARTKAELTLEQAEQQTRIAAKHLQALETGAYHLLPAEAYNIGFVRTYAELLKLNPDKIIQMYRTERSNYRMSERGNPAVQLGPRRIGDWTFLVTPKVLAIVGMVVMFGSIASYIFVQVRKFAQPPQLSINVPSEFTSNRDTVHLEGKTSEGSIISMNAEPITVTADGHFTQEVQLSPGLNQITVLARNRAQKESRQTINVLYKQDLAKANATPTPNQ